MDVEFPQKLYPLFEPHRFKSIRGGRDGAKSWSVARALALIGADREEFIVCARETMNAISDSVHRLIEQQIDLLKIPFYQVEKAKIRHTRTGTEFVFKGLRHNPEAIKSLEGATKLWVEEAQKVSYHSWSKAIPTIRRPGSEIWLTWNPELEDDETHQRFVTNPPPDCLDIVMNYTDNPWASEALRAEREAMERTNPAEYAHIWLGEPRSTMVGAIYEHEMRQTETDGRIGRVPYDRALPVHTAWDIGWGDNTVIWMFQAQPFAWHFIDYVEGNQKDIAEWIRILQSRGYIWGKDYLPWDAASKMFRAELVQTLRKLGRDARILDRGDRAAGINAVRGILSQCWFDRERCKDGIQAMKHYRYGEIERLGTSTREPVHDWASHPADAIRSMAVGVRSELKRPPKPAAGPPRRPVSAWS
jgi:phage terminase large subunit